jgi:hypothetical protein
LPQATLILDSLGTINNVLKAKGNLRVTHSVVNDKDGELLSTPSNTFPYGWLSRKKKFLPQIAHKSCTCNSRELVFYIATVKQCLYSGVFGLSVRATGGLAGPSFPSFTGSPLSAHLRQLSAPFTVDFTLQDPYLSVMSFPQKRRRRRLQD